MHITFLYDVLDSKRSNTVLAIFNKKMLTHIMIKNLSSRYQEMRNQVEKKSPH